MINGHKSNGLKLKRHALFKQDYYVLQKYRPTMILKIYVFINCYKCFLSSHVQTQPIKYPLCFPPCSLFMPLTYYFFSRCSQSQKHCSLIYWLGSTALMISALFSEVMQMCRRSSRQIRQFPRSRMIKVVLFFLFCSV